MVGVCENAMRESKMQPDAFFFAHRGGRGATGDLAEALATYSAAASDHDYWDEAAPQSMVIDEMEAIWAAIDERDDWQLLNDKIAAIRRMGAAHGPPPAPSGHEVG